MNEIIITPYASVGEYKFDTKQKDIEEKFGEANKIIINNIMKNLTELRNGVELIYKKGRSIYRLESVVCSRNTTPIVNGINIFEHNLSTLKKLDADFIEGPEYVTFKKLGISVGGLGAKKIPEKRLVIAFSKKSIDFYSVFPLV